MDTTFITIHDLTEDAHILYSSDSIVDILGHTPDEVVNRSCWEFFHPEEIPLAKQLHSRGVRLDKAAVLSYCRIRNRQGDWVGCECCFSIVYDVMVCCTSIYRRGMSSQKRAVEAPLVRRLFASSPKDPRYHMLSHLSSKFSLGPEEQTHEPRAALFLNRFTRTLTVMYATSGIEQIIGISGETMKGRSFYYCIQENCLEDAVRCLETAKGNDSIAYMRFFFRDPRQDDPLDADASESEDEMMTDITSSEDESEGGVDLRERFTSNGDSSSHSRLNPSNSMDFNSEGAHSNPRTSSRDSTHLSETHTGILGQDSGPRSPTSSLPAASPHSEARDERIELEAVVSCTSDGLVVCLRRARPMVPTAMPTVQTPYHNGIFAAPWAPEPMFLPPLPRPPPFPLGAQHPAMAQVGPTSAFQNEFMRSIRDVAVFAWALTGINGSLAEYSRGKPIGESQPPEGFPIWAPESQPKLSAAPSGYASRTCSSSSNDPFGDPGLS
ncbi:uncharacterized protein BDR25DRAFT_87759 [Lindgomyces ingoldianus]|uniref:Uncharacterized protein n=1 Tax=Lindgomyces ingoldianus TaxID=673940 RepID=A0ACB6R8P1_9PLEO|nr:uncharacterized protein BDR25DRAFT_87759 [Lindgomyces ingoldianus]KAF2475683.1 hypothetical protein BDR25DRAFT_87759 [Lindgomyces ingoldianus]